MSDTVSRTLFEQQMQLTRALLQRMQGIESHLLTSLRPHLSDGTGNTIDDLIDAMDAVEWIGPNLHFCVDAALGRMRSGSAIAAGTTEEQVPIPRDQLIGCTEAFYRRKVQSPVAEAIRLSFQLLQPARIRRRPTTGRRS